MTIRPLYSVAGPKLLWHISMWMVNFTMLQIVCEIWPTTKLSLSPGKNFADGLTSWSDGALLPMVVTGIVDWLSTCSAQEIIDPVQCMISSFQLFISMHYPQQYVQIMGGKITLLLCTYWNTGAQENSMITGSSINNQCIERFWHNKYVTVYAETNHMLANQLFQFLHDIKNIALCLSFYQT